MKQGLCDMVGNISEWVRDGWQDNYDNAPTDDVDVCSTPVCKYDANRVARGRSWLESNVWYLRAASRNRHRERSFRDSSLGFRVLLSSP